VTEPSPDDLDATNRFLGLELDPGEGTARFRVADGVANPRGSLFGGAGVAASVALMEAVTERRALWTTLQFVATPMRGDDVELRSDVLAHGGRMSQVRVTASVDGIDVFAAMGATGIARDDVVATFDRMPEVPPPDDCATAVFDVTGEVERSYFAAVDRRLAAGPDELRGTPSNVAFWARIPGLAATAPLLGYFGDVAAFGVFRALGRPDGRATSIDNTLRIGPPHPTEWVLVDVRTQFVAGGYGHATVDLWALDGTLLGLMSQTVALRTMVN
jgi:acyl-CoA thioesterase-2